jgi:GPI-anchor transamidase subunit K
MRRLLLLMAAVMARNYAILMSSSKGFTNYRHMANVYVFYNILRKNGFSDDEIIVSCYENQMEDCRNADRSAVRLSADVRIPYYPVASSASAFESFMNALEGNSQKLKDADESSNILVYFCGHGNESFLKFGVGKYITRDDLVCRVVKLANRVGKVLLIADTCQAEALLDRRAFPRNVFAVSTSVHGEPSVSTYSSAALATSLVDNFPYVFHSKASSGLSGKMKLRDFFASFDKEDVCSTITCSRSNGFTYGEFFVQNMDDEVLPFRCL